MRKSQRQREEANPIPRLAFTDNQDAPSGLDVVSNLSCQSVFKVKVLFIESACLFHLNLFESAGVPNEVTHILAHVERENMKPG